MKNKKVIKFLRTKQKEYGNYIYCFNTKIRNATAKDIELIPSYGIDLISSYTNVDRRLIRLVEEKNEMGTHSITNRYISYIVYSIPAIILGKLKVQVQQTKSSSQILFVYQKRVSEQQYIKAKKIKGTSKYKSRKANYQKE